MHSHNPEDNASAMRYVPHPDSWSAHPEAGYPAFPRSSFAKQYFRSLSTA